MKWSILMLCLAAMVADAYIFRSLVTPHTRRSSPLRVLYIVFALLTDGAVLSALALYSLASGGGSAMVAAIMWTVWAFFLTLVPKLLYTVGGVVDFLVRLVLRRRVSLFRWVGALVAAVVMVVMVCGATVGRLKTRVEEVEICSSRVPAAFDGYRIVQFSDLHIGTMMRPVRRIARVAEAIAAQSPDMVVFTGDLVNLEHTELTGEVIKALAAITAPDGVRMAWGNHDLGFYIRPGSSLTYQANFEAMSEKIGVIGWEILSDRSTYLYRGADSIALTGVDYPRDTALNSHNQSLAGVDISAAFAGVGSEVFNVVLAHTPRLWSRIVEGGGGDLTLSGHVHAMQTKVRLGRKTWSPARYMYREWSGRYNGTKCGKNSVLYINDGIGCVGYPMRIGARGEITVITLKRCE